MRAITNASGQPVNTRTYAPFGELTTHSGTGSTGLPTEDKGFIGERFDADAGLQYLNARYYDTRLGLFIQPDWSSPVARGVGTNRFAYSGNDPVNQLDPSGLSFLSDLWDAVKGDGSFEATFGSNIHDGLNNFADNLDIGINLGSGNLYGAASGFSPSQALLPDVKELSDDDFGSADVLEIVGLVPTGKLAKPISQMLPGSWKKATNGTATDFIDGVTVVDRKTGTTFSGTVDLRPTLDRIDNGIPHPHRNDGSTFRNRKGLLPSQPDGYYTEFVHPTPGVNGPGPQRIIRGQGGELYYTPDHYESFIPLNK